MARAHGGPAGDVVNAFVYYLILAGDGERGAWPILWLLARYGVINRYKYFRVELVDAANKSAS